MESLKYDLLTIVALAVVIGLVAFSGIQAVHAIGGSVSGKKSSDADTGKRTEERALTAQGLASTDKRFSSSQRVIGLTPPDDFIGRSLTTVGPLKPGQSKTATHRYRRS